MSLWDEMRPRTVWVVHEFEVQQGYAAQGTPKSLRSTTLFWTEAKARELARVLEGSPPPGRSIAVTVMDLEIHP